MPHVTNRRRQDRATAQSPVRLVTDSPLPFEIQGTLLDFSENGFRARHTCPDLQRGDRVRFDHQQGAGSAMVIWTRVVGATIESGFLIGQ